jgi:solute carrier family 35 protein E3
MNYATLGWILGSIFSSTAIIIVNKYVMDTYEFKCITFLTSYHFFATWLLLEIMCRMDLFIRADHVPQIERWTMAAAGVGAVVFMNTNLRLNSVGFYQLSKLCTIPMLVVYKYFFEHKTTPFTTICSLTCLLLGLELFSVNDVQLNVVGSIIAVIGVLCVAVFQSKTGSKQKQFSVSPLALQHATAMPQFLIALVVATLTETTGNIAIWNHSFVGFEVALILLTGIIAVSVNVCAFGLIGKTDAIAYQVVGHVKSILIFIFGLIMFPASHQETHDQFIKKIIGLVIAMIGVITYSWLEIKEKEVENRVEEPELAVDVPPSELPDVKFEERPQ